MNVTIELTVNDESYAVDVAPQTTLLELLRENLRLTGTKEGCGTGDCGACLVLVDGRLVNACLMLAVDVSGKRVTTIEGLGTKEALDPVQEAFIEKGAFQCGFCTPAMILSAKALLGENPAADDQEIKRGLSGVICRCGSYTKILEAVSSVGRKSQNSATKTRSHKE